MKINKLEIKNIRGIPELELTLGCKNALFLGPNGSGKSAVVDALDFLLTGDISRLSGKGTKGISLKKHGPHIDHKPEETKVKAEIIIDGVLIELERSIAEPDALVYPEDKKGYIEPIIAIAMQGQHVLSRSAILKYITAEAGDRAKQIQDLLNISEIEDIRKNLGSLFNEKKKEQRDCKSNLDEAEGSIKATLQIENYAEAIVLEKVNALRAVLSAPPISSISVEEMMKGIDLQSTPDEKSTVNINQLKRDIENLVILSQEPKKEQIGGFDDELRNAIEIPRGDMGLLDALKLRELTKLGLSLVKETGECPLCDAEWEPGQLVEKLKKRLESAKRAEEISSKINRYSGLIISELTKAKSSLSAVIEACKKAEFKEQQTILEAWASELDALLISLNNPIEGYLFDMFPKDKVKRLFAPDIINEVFACILKTAEEKYSATTPLQDSLVTLSRLGENLKSYNRAKDQFNKSVILLNRSKTLSETFIACRDEVLGSLYSSIKDRFVELYKKMHGVDESGFDAVLEPDGAGLKLEVEFYGRPGTHPPHALHSEGHQDSMGVCLYLALAEKLTKDVIDLIVLDDVVMSIDAGHRRKFCELLKSEFPNKQFVITTHDKNWADELWQFGIVKNSNYFQFFNWCVEFGPQLNDAVHIWDKIDRDLEKDDVNSAAAKLRRGSERFFSVIADRLGTQVRFKLQGGYDYGDLVPSSVSQLKKLIGKAKESANSYNNQGLMGCIISFEDSIKDILENYNKESWMLNPLVHYNQWENMTKEDFIPVVEVFKRLFSIFYCPKCGSLIEPLFAGHDPIRLKCNCLNIDWDLVKCKTP